jgi:rhodanese-related sulfurtransferase
MQFIVGNWQFILVMAVSGGMLIWPLVRERFVPGKDIGTLQATQLINAQDALLLDLREPKDYEGGHLPNALHIPQSQLASRGAELAKLTRRPVIAYCERGNRSRSAAGPLAKLGFKDVYVLRGGLKAWQAAGLPLEQG